MYCATNAMADLGALAAGIAAAAGMRRRLLEQ